MSILHINSAKPALFYQGLRGRACPGTSIELPPAQFKLGKTYFNTKVIGKER